MGDPAGRYWIRMGKREFLLGPGDTVIGRSDECQIVVNENLVSRRHALVTFEAGRPHVEDLGSSNGTYLNQARLRSRTPLVPGDRLFIGTFELEVFRRVEPDEPTLIPEATPVGDDVPSSGVELYEAPPNSATPSSRRRRSRADTLEPPDLLTAPTDALDYLARLADKMFTLGRIDAAERILGSELERVLAVARGGKLHEVEIVDRAGLCAVKLAAETLDAHWFDLAIELHLITGRPMREETIQRVAALRAKAPIGNDELLSRYYERLRAQLGAISARDRVLVERIACLLSDLPQT